jgi:hypothetical protein
LLQLQNKKVSFLLQGNPDRLKVLRASRQQKTGALSVTQKTLYHNSQFRNIFMAESEMMASVVTARPVFRLPEQWR